jgi:rubrerythrin
MAQSSSSSRSNTEETRLLGDSTFNIITQIEKKSDFMHTAYEEYIRDAEKDGKPELAKLWKTIRDDEANHLSMLKEELMQDVKNNRL